MILLVTSIFIFSYILITLEHQTGINKNAIALLFEYSHGLQIAGVLDRMSPFLMDKLHDVYLINIIIGFLSSVIDNVPPVAAAMGIVLTHSHNPSPRNSLT